MLAEERVSTEVLQQMWRDSGLNYNQAAQALGWTRPPYGDHTQRTPDVTRFKRFIGLATIRSHRYIYGQRVNRKYLSESVRYKRAVMLAKALGLDPVDYDL